MGRDKLISVRVDSDLVEQFNEIVEKKKIGFCKWYSNNILINEPWRKKLSVSDILELGLQEFIKKYQE